MDCCWSVIVNTGFWKKTAIIFYILACGLHAGKGLMLKDQNTGKYELNRMA
jgi:uncharacterized membrane protein